MVAQLTFPNPIIRRRPLYQFMDTVGDGTGNPFANVDGSLSPIPFKVAPAPDNKYSIERIMIHIVARGTLRSDRYGRDPALLNGLSIKLYRNSDIITDYMGGVPVRTNGDWGNYCYDVDPIPFRGGDGHMVARWTFAKSGQPLMIAGEIGEYLEIMVQDDLSDLISHGFQVQGFQNAWI